LLAVLHLTSLLPFTMAGVRTIAGVSLHDLFNSDEFKEFRRLLEQAVDSAFLPKPSNWEWAGAVYANESTGAIKNAGPTTSGLKASRA
jgi:hypothetical protein